MPTLREISVVAGVHYTSLSRALRGHPGVSPAKAAELRALAEKMGYVPDPMLRALSAYRTTRRPAAFHSVIAWLNPSPVKADWRKYRTFRDYFSHAEQRARKLGFQLEEITLPVSGKGAARVTAMLKARNIGAVIVGPAPEPGMKVEGIGWQNFSAVRIGHSLSAPPLHVVTANQARAMSTVLQQVQLRGYRRPGLFLSQVMDRRVGGVWAATFFRAQFDMAPENRARPLLFPALHPNLTELAAWISEERPDVVIAIGDDGLLPVLRMQGRRVPEDIGLAVLIQSDTRKAPLSGIDESNDVIGIAAIDFVVSMLNRQERGLPDTAQVLFIDNHWVEGKSLRKPMTPG